MILPIYIYGQPVLREVCHDVELNKEELAELTQNMFETLTASSGVGLSGPQIGLPVRIAVIDLDILSDELPEYKNFRHAYYNPHITEFSENTEKMDEGCLSLPGISEAVERADKIRVTYYDDDFKYHDEYVQGYLARVMQHEFDHLDGKMFIDHISPFRRQIIKGKLGNFLKGKAHCSYKVKTVRKG